MKAGDTVAAKYSSGGYYFARIVHVNDDSYDVIYGDGDTGTLRAEDVFPISTEINIDIGYRVLASWHGARMYPGVVLDKIENGKIYKVQWDDDSAPSYILADKIAKLP